MIVAGAIRTSGELSNTITTLPSASAAAALSGLVVDWNTGNGRYHFFSIRCSAMPLSNMASISYSFIRSFTCSTSFLSAISSIYMIPYSVLERTPIVFWINFNLVSLILRRIRAVDVRILSLKLSRGPRIPPSVELSSTPRTGSFLEDTTNA